MPGLPLGTSRGAHNYPPSNAPPSHAPKSRQAAANLSMPYNISKPSLPPTTRVTPLPSLSASEGDNQLTKGIYGKPLKRFIFVFLVIYFLKLAN